jgi:hypothetical protein
LHLPQQRLRGIAYSLRSGTEKESLESNLWKGGYIA